MKVIFIFCDFVRLTFFLIDEVSAHYMIEKNNYYSFHFQKYIIPHSTI